LLFSAGTTFFPDLSTPQASNETCVPYVDPNISTGSNLAFYQVRTYMLFSTKGFPNIFGPRTTVYEYIFFRTKCCVPSLFPLYQRGRITEKESNSSDKFLLHKINNIH